MKNQNGFVPIIIAVVVLVVIGIVGYMMVANNKAPGKGFGVGLNADCKLNDPELCRYMDKSIKIADNFKSGFVGTSVTTDKSGTKTENTWEMAGDSSHFETREGGKELSNMITIGDTTYTKDLADGKWTKFTFKSDSTGKKSFFNTDDIKNQFKDTIKETEDKTVYKALGKEACGSMQCFKYQIIEPQSTDTKLFVYFDDREYVMRKMRTETAESISETMFEFKSVTISAPSPLKASPATEIPSSIDIKKLQEEIQKNVNQSSSSEVSSDGE
ncbi:hypothetical protein HZC27_02465 [Candidatus Roizmanbacteria bacterium]|nr:hypothetical protein [Candidatus Roizmanbacteria bacterium]